ncbi:hypothetical protein DYB32_002569 [Aphanomyces invadans]|uniref:Uncharacterized protein n=1 Tax=Aphanomyces invadans TaxID=157072 RepID=A0A3R6ZTR0_9STRA|nr:hypothetical protein DYB32_002569 [Aphanomyces invadans]
MSVDPILLNDLSPMRITPFENFVFVLDDVGFSVYSGAGYPGQGGVYYGIRGRLYVSSYRLVFVELDPSNRHFRSFSLPLYGISSSHRFRAPFFGRPTYDGIVSPVPGGGLVGPGKFRLTFQGVGFDEFRSFYEPLFEHSRELHRQMNALPNASIVQVPGALFRPDEEFSQRVAHRPHNTTDRDVEKVQKGCESPQFSKSLSWRDAQGKEQQCWSVEARTSKKEGHSFALQVTTVNVRNILVDCLGRLVELMRGDSDGDYPRAARVRIGKHYASTGEVLSMGDVQAMMARQGSEVANIASDCEDGVVAPDVSDDSGEDDE